MKPFFSCVMPVKGARPYMEEALASLRTQDMGEALEIIVQDGDVEPDCGQSDALNKGFSKARGEWLFWLNADDVLLPGALAKVKRLIDTKGGEPLNWIAGNTVYLDENGVAQDVRTDAKWYPWYRHRMSVWTGGPSAFFSRSLWVSRGGLDVSFRFMMDIDLWTRWARAGERFMGMDSYLWGFRMHAGSQTMGGAHEAARREERGHLLAKHGLSLPVFWRNVTRIAKFLDGSWLRRKRASRYVAGMAWREIQA